MQSTRTLDYLRKISGNKIVAGIHNRHNMNPNDSTDMVTSVSGLQPALWSGDFLFEYGDVDNRKNMINEAKAQWKSGSLINIMWHSCSPAGQEPCNWVPTSASDPNAVQSRLTDEQWKSLTTDGAELNNVWKARMDKVATFLIDLQKNGVEVLFRPLHEMNQPVFWWAGRPGSDGTRKLYQLTHDYFVKEKGLTNLIWLWDLQDFGTLVNDLKDYNPGSDYWDVATLDVYEGFTQEKYDAMVEVSVLSGGKPIAIGECNTLPTAETLVAEPKWTFFMSWAEETFTHNTAKEITDLYHSARVVTHDKLPWVAV